MSELRPGARVSKEATEFTVWAPKLDEVKLHIVAPFDRVVAMEPRERGIFFARVEGIGSGTRYFFRLGHDDRPDPASRFQPDGVHAASEVVGDDFEWRDSSWRGVPLHEYVIYECHVGTFTKEGTFDAARAELQRLRDLGITAIEVMPVAQFPGERNWGYDGTYPYAVQNSYGGPEAFRRFVDAAHRTDLAVVLDVVYNHLGPEGNYLGLYAQYFTTVYKTPWGEAINFDGDDSDGVRDYFANNALQWFRDYHVDALRIDAVHAIIDRSAQPFLQELASRTEQFAAGETFPRFLIAESDLNDPRLILPRDRGGFGLDAQWSDDFHHSMHVLLTAEQSGYYADFHGVDDLRMILEKGWLYSGQYSVYRKRRFGAPASGLHQKQFVVCIQNHDQVGNRAIGDRLAAHVDFDTLKTAVGFLLLSPFTPLLFMGEEFAEKAPFQYFTSHADRALVEAVRRGRGEEFAAFGWQGEIADPDAVETFQRSRIDRERCGTEGALMQRFVKRLLEVRRGIITADDVSITTGGSDDRRYLWFMRETTPRFIVVANFGHDDVMIGELADVASWDVLIASNGAEFGGAGEMKSSNQALLVPARSLLAARERR